MVQVLQIKLIKLNSSQIKITDLKKKGEKELASFPCSLIQFYN